MFGGGTGGVMGGGTGDGNNDLANIMLTLGKKAEKCTALKSSTACASNTDCDWKPAETKCELSAVSVIKELGGKQSLVERIDTAERECKAAVQQSACMKICAPPLAP